MAGKPSAHSGIFADLNLHCLPDTQKDYEPIPDWVVSLATDHLRSLRTQHSRLRAKRCEISALHQHATNGQYPENLWLCMDVCVAKSVPIAHETLVRSTQLAKGELRHIRAQLRVLRDDVLRSMKDTATMMLRAQGMQPENIKRVVQRWVDWFEIKVESTATAQDGKDAFGLEPGRKHW